MIVNLAHIVHLFQMIQQILLHFKEKGELFTEFLFQFVNFLNFKNRLQQTSIIRKSNCKINIFQKNYQL